MVKTSFYLWAGLLPSLFISHTANAQLFPDRQQIDQWLNQLGGSNNFDRSKTIDWGVLPGPFYTPRIRGWGLGSPLLGFIKQIVVPTVKFHHCH